LFKLKISLIFIAITMSGGLASSNEILKPCPATGSFHNCFGTYIFSNGYRYEGSWLSNAPRGKGVMSLPNGDVYTGQFGIYANSQDTGVYSFADGRSSIRASWSNIDNAAFQINQSGYFSKPIISSFSKALEDERALLEKFTSNRSIPWDERVSKAVSELLRKWLEVGYEGAVAEVPAPTLPSAIKLTQDIWESNKEFEDRIALTRNVRQKEIDRIQAEYKFKVDARNEQVTRVAQLRLEKERKLPEKRKELTLIALNYLSLGVEIIKTTFDQDAGVLFIDASIDKNKPERYEFKDTPQQVRRNALTSPGSLSLKPEFFVSDSGQFGIKALSVESGGVKVAGTPTQGSAGSQALRLATIDVPVSNLPVLTQQSAITVDKNQVEQILYRDENESLRKRLDEQRKAQELALSEQARRVEQETAKFRAEADAAKRRQQELEQQLAQSSGNKSQVNYGRALNAHALVIGNSAYGGSAKLPNPQNDAKLIAKKLSDLGFKVTEVVDADRSKLVSSLSTFSATAQSADLTMLFYAGHGVQISGTNYMLPIDLNMNDLSQVPLQGVSLSSVVEQYLPGKTKLVFLDACRDNPLMQTASRSVSRGLAPINVSEGTLISYSTKDGQVAQDGEGKNSPFTKALLDHLDDPEDIAVVLRKVREQVMKNTGGKQQPWEYGSLTGGSLVLSAIKKSN
jgi:hypothetical protein